MRKKYRFSKGKIMAAFAAVFFLLQAVPATAADGSYTYNYDYWGEIQKSPDVYSVARVVTSKELGLDKKFSAPKGLYVKDSSVFICDTGNNRIVELERTAKDVFELKNIYETVKGSDGADTFNNPTDVKVTDDGYMFVADKNNNRILKLDMEGNFIKEFLMPDDSSLNKDQEFLPDKITVDGAGRVYAIADGINKGLIKYEADGTFSGFVGANKASYNIQDYLWKKFATKEQRARMESFVPTEYDNVYMDKEGFIYCCTGAIQEDDLLHGKVDAVRRLNLLGDDILVRNGDYKIIGDLTWGDGGGYTGPSYFADVTALDNGIYVCADNNRGRLFGYDDQGRMVFAFGGNGNMAGYFRKPSALDHIGNDLLVLDEIDCSLTVFVPTEFGNNIYNAISEFDKGKYEKSAEYWNKVMDANGNYDLAYIGIGRSLLREEKYKEAMKYFKVKYDDENYSKAFKEYRKEWVEDHIGYIVAVILILMIVPLAIGRVNKMKAEIAVSGVFIYEEGLKKKKEGKKAA
jgi:sugar lactone lactonase YvrE